MGEIAVSPALGFLVWSSEVGCWCHGFSAGDTFESLKVEGSGRADFQNIIETIGLALGCVWFASLRRPSTFHTFMQILQKQIRVCACVILLAVL